jgi:hypothetical protein
VTVEQFQVIADPRGPIRQAGLYIPSPHWTQNQSIFPLRRSLPSSAISVTRRP